jgi:hypothetical protein
VFLSVERARDDNEPVEGRRRGCERFISLISSGLCYFGLGNEQSWTRLT